MLPNYYEKPLAALVRGHARLCGTPRLKKELLEKELDALTGEEIEELFAIGRQSELKLYRFKRAHDGLPRVKRVMGFLRSISFESLLDVGSGRGAFLFPFLTAFPWVQVTSADILDYRVAFLRELNAGGMTQLTATQADITTCPFPPKSHDVVTLLEVLEHIPNVQAAVDAAVKIAKRFVVVSVPSREDNNPEHIHLLTREKLTELFEAAGCTALSFDAVPGHLILFARVGG